MHFLQPPILSCHFWAWSSQQLTSEADADTFSADRCLLNFLWMMTSLWLPWWMLNINKHYVQINTLLLIFLRHKNSVFSFLLNIHFQVFFKKSLLWPKDLLQTKSIIKQ